jgi:phytoene desaturase
MKTQSVLVIGAGIGGLSAAIHLAKAGRQVTIIEKNSNPGGRLDRYTREGHHFDTGPTLFVMPLVYEAEFALLGTPLQELVTLQRVDPTYRIIFDDGSRLALTSDMESMYRQMEAIELGSFRGLLRYMNEGARHYDLSMERLVTRDFRTIMEFLSPRNIPMFLQLDAFSQHYRHMQAYFKDPRLKSAFTFQDVYMGLSPYEAPSTFSMMPYTELAHGVWYPRGGMYSIVEALITLATQAGVEIIYNTEVERIEIAGGKTSGVKLLDGSHMQADVILANADLPYVYQHLLPDKNLAAKLTRKHFSCSVISFFWGLDKTFPELGPHSLFLTDDYRANFKSINRDLTIPQNPSLYVHAPARLEASMAPQGQDTLIAIVPVGYINEENEQDWNDLKEKARRSVLRRLASIGVTDLEEHIKFEVCYTPRSWERQYHLLKGATHGLSHELLQLGYFRPHNRHPHYPNLYFTGASTHPGTGVPTALISGRLAARRIMDETTD